MLWNMNWSPSGIRNVILASLKDTMETWGRQRSYLVVKELKIYKMLHFNLNITFLTYYERLNSIRGQEHPLSYLEGLNKDHKGIRLKKMFINSKQIIITVLKKVINIHQRVIMITLLWRLQIGSFTLFCSYLQLLRVIMDLSTNSFNHSWCTKLVQWVLTNLVPAGTTEAWWSIMSNFSSLTSQELLCLLCVSIVSFKESKRTFLTPDGVQSSNNVMNMSNWSIMSIFSSLTIQKLLRLLSTFIVSIKEAKRTFLTPVGGDTFRGSLEVYKNGVISSQIYHSFTL